MKKFLLLLLWFGFKVHAQTNDLLLSVRLERDLTDSVSAKNKASFFKKGLQQIIKDSLLDERLKPFAMLRWKENNTAEYPYYAGDVTLITRKGYRSLMHNVYHIPVYVAHAIEAEKINRPIPKISRASGYPKDPFYPTLKKDLYSASGYDHGHLAPARDFKHDSLLYKESNFMTNMTPQHGCFNQKGWCYLETLCRYWCTSEPQYVFYIVSGPVLKTDGLQQAFIDSLCIKNSFRVQVPRYYFKAVLAYNEHTGKGKAVGFIVPNTTVENSEIDNMQLTIDELERATGLDFFSYLPNEQERKIEFQIGQFNFEGVKSDCPDKSCDKVYNNRIRPDTRTKLKCN